MALPPSEIDRDAPITRSEKTALGVLLLSPLVIYLAVVTLCAMLCGGCASDSRGVKVVVSSASATNIGDVNWDEYKIPILSIISGPRTTVLVNKDYLGLVKVKAGGCVTNETHALGVYSDSSSRENVVELDFSPVSTNAPEVAR